MNSCIGMAAFMRCHWPLIKWTELPGGRTLFSFKAAILQR